MASLLVLFCQAHLWCSDGQGQVFPVTVTVQTTATPQATFAWGSQASGTTIRVFRRTLGTQGSSTWILRGSSTQPVTTYIDTGLAAGASYEYKIERATDSYAAYTVVTIDGALVDSRGAMMLVVDDTVSAELAGELRQMEMDLVGDGWDVVRLDSPRHGTGTPESLKAAIKSAVAANPSINSVLLFGALPMVRSGLLAPDGHTPDRAHETDTFYADLTGTWTDSVLNVPAAGSAENENIPGDGKYDQDYYPSALELAVGRVTFNGMPSFRKKEREYLRDYLHKDHAWRMGQRAVQYRSLLSDTNSGYYLFTARNWMTPMFGTANVQFSALQPATSTGTYLWAVACDDLGPISGSPVQAIFMESFKSWKQMWWRSDNAIRGMMTQPDWGLASCWGARPPWYFHHMAAGRTIGYSALRTQNNPWNGNEYTPGDYSYMNGYVSNNLQGDPTLRMHPVLPPGAVTVGRSGATANLAWGASSAAGLIGYHVYRSTSRLSGYARLTASPITAMAYADASAPAGVVYYQVRAVAMTSAPTGTYANQSEASFALLEADGTGNRAPTATPASMTAKSNSPVWFLFRGSDPDGDALTPMVIQNPQHGQLRWYKGQPFYVSGPDYVGADSFAFVMSDGAHVSPPATIAVTVDAEGDTLLGWKCPDVSGTPPTDATFVHTSMQGSAIVFGSGSPRSNPFPYTDQIFIKYVNGAALDASDYLGWTVAPQAGFRQSLSRVTFGLASSNSALTLNAALRASTDGFATWIDVPLQLGQSNGAWSINTAGLSGFAALQGTTAAVAFRLYIWDNGSAGDSAGFGKITDVGTDKIEDLVVQGSVAYDGTDQAPAITTAKPGALATLEDSSGSLALAATDADGDPLTWSVSLQGAKGTAAIVGSGTSVTATYAPLANQTGSDSFVARVSDGRGGSDTITVNVTITPVNDAPSFLKGADQAVAEDSGARSVSGWATAIGPGPTDEVGQTVTFTVVAANPALFSAPPAVSSAGALTFTPAANANGATTVSVTAHDNGGTANGGADTGATATFTVTITAVNDAPTFTKGANQTVAEDSGARTVPGWATAISPGPSDETAQTVGFTVTAATPGLFSAQPAVSSTGALTFTPAPNANGSTSVSVVATDSAGASSASQSFTIAITAVNDGPVVASPIVDQSAVVGGAYGFTVPAGTFADVDSGVLTWSATGLPAWLSFNATTHVFSGTPAAGDVGTTSITVSASDGALSVSDTFVMTVGVSANTPPSITTAKPGTLTVSEDGSGTFAVAASDADGDTLTWNISVQGGKGTATVSGTGASKTVTYATTANLTGADTFTVRVNDGRGGVDTIVVNVAIAAVNDAPSFTKGANQTVAEDSGARTVAGWATAISPGPSDEAAQTVGFTVTAATTSLFSAQPAVSSTGALTFTPAPNANGSTSVSVVATDSAGASSAAQSFTIAITAVNDPPVLAAAFGDVSLPASTPFSFTVPAGTFSDADGSPLTWSASGLPAWASFAPATRIISGTPTVADVGSIGVTITVADPSAATASYTFKLVVYTVADTTPPTTPPAPALGGSDPALPMLSGATEAGATVHIYDNGSEIGSAVADGGGAWTWTATVPLGAGSHALTVVAVDGAGNASAASPAVMVVIPRAGGGKGGGSCGGGLGGLAVLLLALPLARPRRGRRSAP